VKIFCTNNERYGTTKNSNTTRTPKRTGGTSDNCAPGAIEITPARAAGEEKVTFADGDAGGMPGVFLLFWESPEMAKLLGFDYNSGEDVFMGLKERVKIISKVLQSCDE
jgi:hypothetical protein